MKRKRYFWIPEGKRKAVNIGKNSLQDLLNNPSFFKQKDIVFEIPESLSAYSPDDIRKLIKQKDKRIKIIVKNRKVI